MHDVMVYMKERGSDAVGLEISRLPSNFTQGTKPGSRRRILAT